MSVVAQLPPELGGASGKVRQRSVQTLIIFTTPFLQVAYIDTEGVYMYACPFVPERHVIAGTFRPDRIKSIADRFGVNGDMALENILYGALASAIDIY